MSSRFQDWQHDQSDLLTEVWVVCHRCASPGVVRSTVPYWQSTPTFTCSACGLSLRGRHTSWVGPCHGWVRSRCSQCGRWLHHSLRSANGYGPRRFKLQCPGCSLLNDAPVEWSPESSGPPVDPTFGLALRLQTPCLGHTLWAYNPKHLDFLRSYVEAKVRERVPNANASLASRLPKWLKLARNRRSALAALDKLAENAAA